MWHIAGHIGGAALLGCIAALYFGPIVMTLAHKFNFLDIPDLELKNHKQPVAYAGGLVVYLGMLVSLMLFFPLEQTNVFFILGSTFLLLIGLIDDCICLTPLQKITGQLLAAICFVKGGLYLKTKFLLAYEFPLAYFFWPLVSGLWILSVINAFNLIDVMDGLAATTALTASLGLFTMALLTQNYSTALLLASFMGALVGFLWYNKPEARLYLGDAGSLFVGGILATVPFMISWGTFSRYGYCIPVVLLAVPLLELGTLIVIRTFLGIPFYHGSPHHFSHFLRAKEWSCNVVLRYVIFFSTLLTGACLLYIFQFVPLVGFIALFFILIVTWYSVLVFPQSGKNKKLLLSNHFKQKRSGFFEKAL